MASDEEKRKAKERLRVLNETGLYDTNKALSGLMGTTTAEMVRSAIARRALEKKKR